MATQIVINDPASQRHVPAPAVVIVSSDANNALKSGSDGNLFVEKPEDANLVSKQAGNYVRYGSDKGVYMDGNDVLSNGKTNLLHTSDRDGRVELTAEDLKEAGIGSGDVTKAEFEALKAEVATTKSDVQRIEREVEDVTVVSTDRNNVLVEGRDGGAYLSADDIVDVVEEAGITGKVDVQQLINLGTDPLLGKAGDKLISGLSVQYNQVSGRLDILGVNGQSVAHTEIPTAVQLLERVSLEDNPAGQPAGTYIHFEFRLTDQSVSHVYLNVNKLAQFYSAGDGIKIGSDGAISIDTTRVEGIVDDAIDEELGRGGSIRDAIAQGVEDGIADALEPRGEITTAIKNGIDDAVATGGAIDTAIKTGANNAITEALKPGGAISEGITDAFETSGVKDKIEEIVEDAIKSGDVSIVSDDTDNMLKKGTDGGAFLDKADIPAAGPSADAGNALTTGSDGKLYFQPVADYGSLD